jgi:FG-GAP-like repeat
MKHSLCTSISGLSAGLSAIVSLLGFFSSTLCAQVSFFNPPTYSGDGNVFAADFNGDGKLDLLTGDGYLTLGNGDGTFKPATTVSGAPLAVADFNGDGKPDVLEQGTGTLLVLLGNGDGTFQAPVSTPSGASLAAVAAADLNGDGKIDVVGVFNNSLIVYIGHGDGTFAPGVSYNMNVVSLGQTVLSLGDLNGDNKTDIVVSTAGDVAAGQEIAFLGNGDGTFQTAKSSMGVPYPSSAVVGDFNGDGKGDLLVSGGALCSGTCTTPATTYILLGNGNGSFFSPSSAFPGNGPVAARDLNGDGKLDVVSAGDQSIAQIHLGNGDGTFAAPTSYVLHAPFLATPSGTLANGIVIADLNHDGKVDIAVSNVVLLGEGSGTFSGIPFGLIPDVGGTQIGPVVVGAFDKTSAPGAAILQTQFGSGVSTSNLYILSNSGKGVLSLAHTYNLPQLGSGIATADFNGDGNLDLIILVFGGTSWGYSVALGNGDGSFQPSIFYSQGSSNPSVQTGSVIVADFNGDKKLDFAVPLADQTLAVLLGNGDGTFAPPVSVFDAGATRLSVGDFNGDGKPDIAASGNNNSIVGTALIFGNGDGTFQPAVFPPNLSTFEAQFTADVNDDGKVDLLSANQVALGNGDGTFTLLPVANFYQSTLQVADFNGDGKTDLLINSYTASGHASNTAIVLGNGDGTFGPQINVSPGGVPNGSTGALPTTSVVADMNNDGLPDIVFPLQTTFSGVAVMLNNTLPTFSLSAGALSPSPIAAGASAVAPVQISPNAGFTGSVTLSCVGLPSGATCQFDPTSVPGGSGASSLTILTTSSVVAGTYPVQVKGTAGPLASTGIVSLVVQALAAADFAIAPSQTSQTVTPGQSTSFTLALTPGRAFSGTVSLSCAVTPVVTHAPTCALSSSSVQLNGAAQSVTVMVGTTAPATAITAPHVDFRMPTMPFIGRMWSITYIGLIWLALRYRRSPALIGSLLLILSVAVVAGCGDSVATTPPPASTPGTPSGTFTVTVTATSSAIQHTTQMTVMVP